MKIFYSLNSAILKAFMVLFVPLISISTYAQEIRFTASAQEVVEVGEQFRLTYSLNFNATGLRLPDLGNFQLISGPATSSSSSVQIINGEMTRTHNVTFTYVLRATETGEFSLGPATVTTESDQFSSNPVTIEVVADSQGRQAASERTPSRTEGISDVSGKDVFVRIFLDKKEVFQGEALRATIKLYSKLDLTGIENVRFPSFSSFYQQNIETPPLRNLDREVIDGEIYGTGILRQIILFPQRSGEIKIDSFEMDALVRQRTGRRGSLFDDFFGGFENRRIPVKTDPVIVNVKPLPGTRPAGFEGAVGSFSLDARLDPDQVRTNEALNFQVTISGNGNLGLLSPPGIDFPDGFEVYDPNTRENIKNSSNGQEGTITWEYLIIPRSAGNYTIPPVQFSYFDPEVARYRSLESGGINLLVEKGEDTADGPAVAGHVREDLRVVGSDIRFIKTTGVVLKKIDHDLYGSLPFYLWYIAPVIILTVFILLQNKSIRNKADIARMKNRRAGKMARGRLKVAGRHLREDNSQQFFEETLKAIWGYLSDKLLIPVSELNRQNSGSALIEKGVPENDVKKLMAIIDECEFARYAPSSGSTDMNLVYNDTVKILTLIEQSTKR